MRSLTHWDRRYLELARFISGWSKDPSTKVGAVITDPQQRIVSVGFNGLPRGVLDSMERLTNRDVKYKMVVHAESNALLFAGRPVTGCSMYLWPFMPCAPCAGKLIQAGIAEVVTPRYDVERWAADFALVRTMFAEAGVRLLELSDPLEATAA